MEVSHSLLVAAETKAKQMHRENRLSGTRKGFAGQRRLREGVSWVEVTSRGKPQRHGKDCSGAIVWIWNVP
jgi:hypothetical protein